MDDLYQSWDPKYTSWNDSLDEPNKWCSEYASHVINKASGGLYDPDCVWTEPLREYFKSKTRFIDPTTVSYAELGGPKGIDDWRETKFDPSEKVNYFLSLGGNQGVGVEPVGRGVYRPDYELPSTGNKIENEDNPTEWPQNSIIWSTDRQNWFGESGNEGIYRYTGRGEWALCDKSNPAQVARCFPKMNSVLLDGFGDTGAMIGARPRLTGYEPVLGPRTKRLEPIARQIAAGQRLEHYIIKAKPKTLLYYKDGRFWPKK
ncbi:MAG: hypothetical protein P9M14_07940 [Candidatus Alcyoniella australis]|nr:hypothetical protein [Candidatus Alcyoniella australis]